MKLFGVFTRGQSVRERGGTRRSGKIHTIDGERIFVLFVEGDVGTFRADQLEHV